MAASTGASLAASALAGLAALSGPRHGGAAAAVQSLAREAAEHGPRAAVQARLADGTAGLAVTKVSSARQRPTPPG